MTRFLTCCIIIKNSRGYDSPTLGKIQFQFVLGHILWQVAYIKVSTLNALATWSCEGNLSKNRTKKNESKNQNNNKIIKNIPHVLSKPYLQTSYPFIFFLVQTPFFSVPVFWSYSILDVMISPQSENICSKSNCVKDLGRPDIYRLAPLILSQLGRAKET